MSGTPVVTLGGVTLGGDSTYAWDLSYGCRPSEQVFLVSAERAAAIPLGVPLTLRIDGVKKPLQVEQVYCLEVTAAANPNQRVLRLADRRWLWGRKWVASSFNMRRASGDTTLQSEAGQPIEIAQIEPTIRYAKWSLDPPTDGERPWTAVRVLDFVFEQLGQPYWIEDDVPQVEIQDLEIDDDGAAALERVLQHLPGADLYLDSDGVARVVNTITGKGSGSVLPRLGPLHVAGGDIQIADRRALRPSAVVVLFTPEVEVRFDYSEGATRTRDTATLINVAASPDLTLTLSNSKTVARGTYVPLETLFATWGDFPILGTLSLSTLAAYAFKASILEQKLSRLAGLKVISTQGVIRARTAIESWRRVFQIDELFMQRLASIRANRVAIINPSTGLRARSEVYCDFVRRPNTSNLDVTSILQDATYGWSVTGYADDLEDATAAPASVEVIGDPSAGIVRVEPQLDPWSRTDAVLLGTPNGGSIPLHCGDAEANRTGLDTAAQWASCSMSETFQLSTVLTTIPASPNTIARFQSVTVQASDVGTDGSGPPVYVRVFPGVMSARFAWADGEIGEAIKAHILRGDPIPETQLVNMSDIREVARASAQAVYANFRDEPTTTLGPAQVDMDPSIKPSGPLGLVRHGLDGGVTVTTVTATGFRKPVDLWPFLGAATRKAIRRILTDGGAQ